MAKASGTPQEQYDALFATTLRAFMDCHPATGVKTTQKALAEYLEVRPQTVAYYCNPTVNSFWRLLSILE